MGSTVLSRCLPWQQQRVTGQTQVTGEQEAGGTDRDQGAGGSQDVAGPAQGQLRTRGQVTVLAVFHRFERLVGRLGVSGVVQRAWRVVSGEPL